MLLISHNLLFTFYFFSSPNDGSSMYIYFLFIRLRSRRIFSVCKEDSLHEGGGWKVETVHLNIFLLMAGGKQEQYEARWWCPMSSE